MSDDNSRETTQTQTRTRTQDENGAEEAEASFLTPEEERVVRARHGLSEDDDHELNFALGADEETEARLEELEQFLVRAFDDRKEEGQQYFPESIEALEQQGAKASIVEALRDNQPDDSS